MCIKKMFITLLLVSISLLPLYSQTETAGNGGEVIDLDEARSAIEEERISQVNELLTENKIVEIEELFTSDEEAYFTLLKENDIRYANFVREMMFKAYRNVSSLQDDLLFVECKKDLYSQDWDLVSLKANDLIRRYPDSNRKDMALRYWKLALFKSGKDQEYIALVEQNPEFNLAQQKFQYGQSLYNVGRLDEAQKFLEDAAADENDTRFVLRSTATLGLIALAKGNVDEAVSIFDILQKSFSPDTPYYDFILLSIARLFSHYGDPQTAITYYQAYSQLNNNNVDEVIYEIGIAHRKAGNLEKAKKAFEKVLETNFADKYYVQALYNLVLIDQELNDGKSANELMTNYQVQVDDYFDSLLKNRNLMTEIRSLRNDYLMEGEKSRKEILLEQIRAKEEEVLANQVALEQKISFLDVKSVQLIKELELSFLERTENYFVELDLIDQYRNTPKDELIAIANRDRLNKEDDYLLSITEELIEEIPTPTDDQFLRAFWYANQIYLKKKYIVNLSNLIDKTKSYPSKNTELRKLLDDELENLDEIRIKAKFDLAEFPNLAEKQELAEQKVNEFLAAESVLEAKRKKVIDTYYEKMADKKQQQVIDSFNDLDKNINVYARSIDKFTDIKNEQQQYVDFISLDLEYRKITESYRFSLEQASRDSVALTEEEFQQFADQYESLYNKMNSFVFRHNEFENNARLYFDMAEIATIVYGNNYNLIYDNYKKVLDLKPDYPQKDIVLYNMAYYKNQILDSEINSLREEKMKDKNYFYNPRPPEVTKTVDRYQEVIKNYLELSKDVNSKYQIESMLRLAKLYYDIAVDADETGKYIGYSIKIFDQIYALGNTDQKYEALFQRAWHKMAIQNYAEAIADLELLMANSDDFNDYQRDKYSTTEEIVVYSLSALDRIPEEEIKSYTYVKDSLFYKYDKETAQKVFNKLVDQKGIFDEYEDIIRLYDARSRVEPLAITNPTYTDSIIVTMSNYGLELGDSLNVRAEREYRKAIERYGYGSEWYEHNKNNDLSPYVKVIQVGLDKFIIPQLYNDIIDNPTLENIEEFTNATQMYANYVGFDEEVRAERLKLYDQNNISTIVKYVRSKQDTVSYSYGIDEIYSYIDRNPESDIRNNLEQNAYGWAYNITVITDTTTFDSLAYTQQQIDEIRNEKRKDYINSADRYYDYLVSVDYPDKDEIIHSLLFYRGLAKAKLGDNVGAKEDFLACNDLDISDEFKEGIFRNLAEIYKADGDLDTSIEYLAKAQEYVDDDMKIEYEREIYNTRSDKIRLLNNSGNQEDKIKAAKEMEIVLKSSVIDEAKKAEIRKQAIAQYASAGDFDTAIDRLVKEGNNSVDVEKAWENYSIAINIAADSLRNDTKVAEIENIFMDRFPYDQQTFALLIQRLDVVQDSTLSTYDPLIASQKMLEIYDRATQEGEKLDISSANLKPEDYYYSAIVYKNKTLSKEEQALEWIAFNAKFPEYESILVLNTICQLYEDTGNAEEYLKYIKILYKADNTNVRYPAYAVNQLKLINDEISKAFRNEDWNNMLLLIEDYKQEAEIYTSDGIPAESIAIPTSLERYNSYTLVYENVQAKKALLEQLKQKFDSYMEFVEVPADAKNRIKVNNYIAWNGNLYGKNKLINNFIDLTKKQFESIEADANLAFTSELLSPEEKRLQVYLFDFAKFKISKYAGDLIFNQINKYLELPNGQFRQYENLILNRTDLTFDEQDQILDDYLFTIKDVREQYLSEFNNISIPLARAIYANYINGITDPLPRSEEVIAFLQVVGASDVVPTDEKNIAFESSWRKDFSPITETVINDGHRDFMIYTIPGGESLQLETNINCPILPNAARIRFVDEGDFWFNDKIEYSIKVNDKQINVDNLYLPDGVIDDSLSTFPYLIRGLINDDNLTSLNYQIGNNTLSITVTNNSYEDTNIGFNYAMIYDKEKLYIHENSIMISVVSDNSWLGADSLETIQMSDPGWNPVRYGNLDIDYYQFDIFKNSLAVPIWYGDDVKDVTLEVADTLKNVITVSDDSLNTVVIASDDSLNVNSDNELVRNEPEVIDQPTVKYFIKEFDVTGNVIDGIIYFIANESANIYLNGMQIGYSEPYYFAPPDAPYLYLEAEDLVPGKNVIVFEVDSPTQNNGLLVDIQIRTLIERR